MPKQFDHDLGQLKSKLLLMGATTEQMLHDTLNTIEEKDMDLFKPVEEAEEKMDTMQIDIDDETVRLITVYTPVARDLRFLLMISRINAELERIADHAVNIGFYTKNLLKLTPLDDVDSIPDIGHRACKLLRLALDAFSEGSSKQARAVIEMDDVIDRLHDKIFRELVGQAAADPDNMTRVIELVLISRAFERIGDHAVNIAEDTIYMVKGEDVRHPDQADTDDQPS